jgi:hypothetical protein
LRSTSIRFRESKTFLLLFKEGNSLPSWICHELTYRWSWKKSRKSSRRSTPSKDYTSTRVYPSVLLVRQKFMENLLRDLPFCSCYLDDMLIHGGVNEKEHWEHVKIVLKRFQEANIRLHFKKCLFAV